MISRIVSNDRCLQILEYNKIIELWADQASTHQGREQILNWHPASEPVEIERALDETAEAVQVIRLYTEFTLGGVYDLREILKRVKVGALLNSEEFLAVLSTIQAARKNQTFLLSLEIDSPILKNMGSELQPLMKLEKDFEKLLDEHGEISDQASPELARIRRETRSLQSSIRNKLDGILKSSEYQKYFQEALVSVRGNRYVIPVKQEYRYQFPGLVHDQSASGHTVFIEPMALVEINNDLAQLQAAERNEVERLVRILTGMIAQDSEFIARNLAILVELDLIFSKAWFSQRIRGERPQVASDGQLRLVEARHPLIPDSQIVPITLEMAKGCEAIVITGPNTGGKTVALKTVGLLVAMHQSGLFVPAAPESRIPLFKGIFSDIGDEQSLEQSLSTFSGHMKQIIEIMDRLSGKGDLVLLDELGAGTDPEEGTALAIAILEKLLSEKARVLLTSHYGELKAYAFGHPNMENASMEFDLQSLKPTYRLISGLPGESNALAIGKRLGLPEEIVQAAASRVREETQELNHLLQSLRGQRDQLMEDQVKIEELKNDLSKKEFKIKKREEELEEKKEKILKQAKEDSKKILSEGKAEMELILDSLKELRQGQLQGGDLERVLQSERDRMRGLTKKMTQALESDAKNSAQSFQSGSGEITAGDGVYVSTLKQSGKVLSIEGSQVWIEVGSLKLKVPLAACQKTASPPVLAEKKADSGRRRVTRAAKTEEKIQRLQSVGTEIDVRGETGEEALLRVERFIDESLMAGSPFIRIIHGKGTGVLKTRVQEMLRNHPSVKSVAFAPYNQGGDGATEVKL